MTNKEIIEQIAQLEVEQQIEAYKCLNPEAYLAKLRILKKLKKLEKLEK